MRIGGAMDQQNYYQILGIQQNATTSEIPTRYEALAKLHHPDRGGDLAKMSLVNRAYEVLSDPKRRYVYNQTLATAHKASFSVSNQPFSRSGQQHYYSSTPRTEHHQKRHNSEYRYSGYSTPFPWRSLFGLVGGGLFAIMLLFVGIVFTNETTHNLSPPSNSTNTATPIAKNISTNHLAPNIVQTQNTSRIITHANTPKKTANTSTFTSAQTQVKSLNKDARQTLQAIERQQEAQKIINEFEHIKQIYEHKVATSMSTLQ